MKQIHFLSKNKPRGNFADKLLLYGGLLVGFFFPEIIYQIFFLLVVFKGYTR